MDNSCKKSFMTSYGGIIRIRLKGRSHNASSQPAMQAPLYFVIEILHPFWQICKCFFIYIKIDTLAGADHNVCYQSFV